MIEIHKLEQENSASFAKIDQIALFNQHKVLEAFRQNKIAPRHFAPSYGYGYGDEAREKLCAVYKTAFNAQDAFVSPLFTGGTHAISTALFGVCRPNDTLISISGKPYDTLFEVINGKNIGSLKDFGILYKQIELKDNDFDHQEIQKALKQCKNPHIYITRSRGYEWRDALTLDQIEQAICKIRATNPNVNIIVDNCYGEFTQKKEPLECGADLIIGSLIKNCGGGIAPGGGYIAGKATLVRQCQDRFFAPAIGHEVGAYHADYRPFFQGFFVAPHTVAQSLKGLSLLLSVLKSVGFTVLPHQNTEPSDIVGSVKFDTRQEAIEFCQLIQSLSPIDSHVVPEAWAMPGYQGDVIMAAGTFVQGASIELSCDSPLNPPIVYLQGGLTYEHIKIVAKHVLEHFASKA